MVLIAREMLLRSSYIFKRLKIYDVRWYIKIFKKANKIRAFHSNTRITSITIKVYSIS
jgi:hypothetical protein